MSNSKGRRMLPSSGYIGAGNKTSVFTWRAKRPFSELKALYHKELENRYSGAIYNSTNYLSDEGRTAIKEQIRKEQQSLFIKKVIAMALAILLTIGFGYLIIFIILKNAF